jgi:hypothetical protein
MDMTKKHRLYEEMRLAEEAKENARQIYLDMLERYRKARDAYEIDDKIATGISEEDWLELNRAKSFEARQTKLL